MNNRDTQLDPRGGDVSGSALTGAAPGDLGVLASAEQQRATAEIIGAMQIARVCPRNRLAAIDLIKNECTRVSLAERAEYSYSRGGTEISGPTIRLAETVAQCWGNVRFGIRELQQEDGKSTVQAYAVDCETGTHAERTFVVKHVRSTRGGSYPLTDPRDIYEVVANNGSRRLRACLLQIIPGDVMEIAQRQCAVTLKGAGDVTPEGITALVTSFKAFGVSKEQIEKRIQRRVDTIRPAQMVSLRRIWTSLNDDMSVASEWFDAPSEPAEAMEAAKPGSITEDAIQGLKASAPQGSTEVEEDLAWDYAAVARERENAYKAACLVKWHTGRYKGHTIEDLARHPTGKEFLLVKRGHIRNKEVREAVQLWYAYTQEGEAPASEPVSEPVSAPVQGKVESPIQPSSGSDSEDWKDWFAEDQEGSAGEQG